MFNKKMKGNKMSEQQTVWLVIEKYVYSNSRSSHSVKKTAYSVEEAIGFKLALEKLNDQKDVSYFLASDVDTVMNTVTSAHNKSVQNGTYYDEHPEIKKPEDKKDGVVDDITF